MSQRKEYNDRWHAPLVNPAFTIDEYQRKKMENETRGTDTIEAVDFFSQIKARSEPALATEEV